MTTNRTVMTQLSTANNLNPVQSKPLCMVNLKHSMRYWFIGALLITQTGCSSLAYSVLMSAKQESCAEMTNHNAYLACAKQYQESYEDYKRQREAHLSIGDKFEQYQQWRKQQHADVVTAEDSTRP